MPPEFLCSAKRAANPLSLRKAAMGRTWEILAMNVFTKQFFAVAGLIAILWAAPASPLLAGVQDYEFQLVQNEAKKGDAIVAVRLVNKRTGKAVPDAVIAAKRIDMAPDGMADMAGRIEQLPSDESGVYRFKANLSMQGSWQLSLAAKVQGENGTVESKLVLKVLP
jgi:YtkA-like